MPNYRGEISPRLNMYTERKISLTRDKVKFALGWNHTCNVPLNVVHVNIYEGKGSYVSCSYLHYYYSCIWFFQWKPVTKKICKSNWWHYDKLLEIPKLSGKFLLAKFYNMLAKRFGGWYQTKMLKRRISST